MNKLQQQLNSKKIVQIRFHGRGGQGVVTGAEIIAVAAFKAGKYAQAFPFFGVERTGAPIQAFARISEEPIIIREQIYDPNIVMIQDATLLSNPSVIAGTDKQTTFIVNTTKTAAEVAEIIALNPGSKLKPVVSQIIAIDATDIAMKIIGRNIVNTVILGTLAKITNLVGLKELTDTIKEKFSGKDEKIISNNIEAITAAYNQSHAE